MTDAVIRMPSQARAGDVIAVRALVRHPQESGFRHDNVGKPIPRHIVETFVCRYDGREVFRARLSSGITTNPYFHFHVKAIVTGDLEFTWTDDRGKVIEATAHLVVG
ncbi:MAG: thiosulfate oxidation carrier complex protein SoxZ [Burkholderiales bacterium]